MAEYREYINALRQCAKEHEKDKLYTGQINTSDLCNDTAKLLENDVIERSEHDRAVQAFKVLVEIKNVNLIAMRDQYYALEKEYAELKVNIDKAIEEIRRESIEVDYYANMLLGSSHGMRTAIGIFKRNIGK